jgi:Ca-activated chloride channel homolog
MRVSRLLLLINVWLCVCVWSGPPARGQARAQAPAQRPITADVHLVQVPVIVFDQKGAIATTLKKSDFRLSDDGVVQQILHLDRVRTPVSFVILADLSSSMTHKISFVQQAALSLLDPPDLGNHEDEYCIVGIGNRARRLVSFTSDQEDLQRRVPLLLTATKETTALFDGIYLGVTTAKREAVNQRRAMIVISDGGDNHSLYNIRETRGLLEEADVPVFAVMAGPAFELPNFFPRAEKKRTGAELPQLPIRGPDHDYIGPAERRGPHNLRTLTEVTGGGTFTAKNEEDLARIVQTIGLAVRYQYVLSYQPIRASSSVKQLKSSRDPNLHKIHLELYPKDGFKGYSFPYYRSAYHSPE